MLNCFDISVYSRDIKNKKLAEEWLSVNKTQVLVKDETINHSDGAKPHNNNAESKLIYNEDLHRFNKGTLKTVHEIKLEDEKKLQNDNKQ